MANNVIINKCAIIERCLQRIQEEYLGHENEFEVNFTKQDSIILNLQRACEATIDLASYVVRRKKLGVPQSSRDMFVLLANDKIISTDLSEGLQKMVGFRNIAIHEYQNLEIKITRSIIEDHLKDFLNFTKIILTQDCGCEQK